VQSEQVSRKRIIDSEKDFEITDCGDSNRMQLFVLGPWFLGG
jgi:hypothetical protein